jgi:hypothetical protein
MNAENIAATGCGCMLALTCLVAFLALVGLLIRVFLWAFWL